MTDEELEEFIKDVAKTTNRILDDLFGDANPLKSLKKDDEMSKEELEKIRELAKTERRCYDEEELAQRKADFDTMAKVVENYMHKWCNPFHVIVADSTGIQMYEGEVAKEFKVLD